MNKYLKQAIESGLVRSQREAEDYSKGFRDGVTGVGSQNEDSPLYEEGYRDGILHTLID